MIKENKTFYRLLSLAIVVLALGIPLLIGHLNGKRYDSAIRENSSITQGSVYDFEHKIKHSAVLKYEFEYEGKKYYSSSSSSNTGLRWEDEYKILFQQIKGKVFPIYFSRDNPARYNKILISPKDFEEFNINYPDSLNWVKMILDRH
jgi:hypothetical protein